SWLPVASTIANGDFALRSVLPTEPPTEKPLYAPSEIRVPLGPMLPSWHAPLNTHAGCTAADAQVTTPAAGVCTAGRIGWRLSPPAHAETTAPAKSAAHKRSRCIRIGIVYRTRARAQRLLKIGVGDPRYSYERASARLRWPTSFYRWSEPPKSR